MPHYHHYGLESTEAGPPLAAAVGMPPNRAGLPGGRLKPPPAAGCCLPGPENWGGPGRNGRPGGALRGAGLSPPLGPMADPPEGRPP